MASKRDAPPPACFELDCGEPAATTRPLPVAGVGPDPHRWPALLVYIALCGTQGLSWATFSAVPVAVTQAFFAADEATNQVSKLTVDLLLSWGLVLFVPALLPAMWLQGQRARGLLLSLRAAAALTAAGCLVRCVPVVWCAHAGQVCIGIATPCVWNACASFSSAWFPPKERTIATALGGAASFAGMGLQFLAVLNVSSGEQFAALLRAEAVLALGVALAVFGLLPAQPRRPPSLSAAAHAGRTFRANLLAFCSSRDCWLVSLAAGVTSGVFGVYSSSIPVLLHRDEGELMSKWLGFCSTAFFVSGSLALGLLSDRCFARRLRSLLLRLAALSLAAVVAFALALPSPVSSRGFAHSELLHFGSMGLLSTAVGGIFPVAIELAAELAYPADESIVVGAVTGIYNIAGVAYVLFMDRIPNADVNLPFLFASLLALALVSLCGERYARRDADESPTGS